MLVELFDCPAERLNDVAAVQLAMEQAAIASGATIINSTFHHFAPVGVSGVVVIQESHLALHTWPEYGFAALDVFTCGDSVDPWVAYHHLKSTLEAREGATHELRRGTPDQLSRQEIDHLTRHTKPQISELRREAWFTERRQDLAVSLRHEGPKLFAAKGRQRVEVIRTTGFGAALVLDGEVVMTEQDGPVYHEMLVHVPLQALSHSPQRVLVLGGGDGGAAKELLRYPEIEQITVVEYDPQVREAARVAFPSQAKALESDRVCWVEAEGLQWLKTAQDTFDVILVDTPAHEGAYPAGFFEALASVLAPEGVLSIQSGSPSLRQAEFARTVQEARANFPTYEVEPYLAHLPSYPTGIWSYLLLSPEGIAHPLDRQFEGDQLAYYYNKEVHRAAFALPNFVRQLIRTTK